MKKKILSLVLVVAMLASMLVFAPVSGATEAKATVRTTNATATAGETVSVDVMLTTAEVKTMTLIFEFDASRLEFLGYEAGAKFPGINSNYDTNAAYQQWVANGPYLTLGFNSLSGIVDCSTETHFATLNFKVKDDAALGDAFVAFRHLEGAVEGVEGVYYAAKIVPAVTENVIQEPGEIEYITSAVTVLPSSYASLTPTDASLFKIDTAEDMEAGEIECIAEYKGEYGGTIVIPEIHTVLNYRLFSGIDKDTTIIVPASIELVGTQCFRRPAAGVTVTVIFLGDDTEFEDEAFSTRANNGKFVVISAPGSTAQTVAQETSDELADDDIADWVTWKAPEDVNLTVNGVTYLVPTDAKAPGVMAIGDETVIGWKSNDGKTYGAGETMALTGATTLAPVTIKTPKMNTEVGFMLTDKITTSRMRYTTDMAVADYEKLASLGTVTLGTIITPAAYVSMAGGLTKEALTQLAIDNVDKIGALPDGKTGAGLTYIDVPASAANPFKVTADTYTFAGSLAGFKAENIDLAYAAAFYATVTIDEETSFTIYSAFDFGANRAVGATVEAAKAKAETNELKDAYDDLIEMIKANTSTAN